MERPLPRLAKRLLDSHKGDYGHAVCIGGSRGMAGAIAISAMSALRSGAGLVTAVVPDPILETVAGFHPSLMTLALPSDAAGRMTADAVSRLSAFQRRGTCFVLGPGLGQSEMLDALVRQWYFGLGFPMIVDADGLNALSRQQLVSYRGPAPRIWTPHPGEFARFSGVAAEDRRGQIEAAVAWAKAHQLIIVLKGHETRITDGESTICNRTGNPSMAVGGSGDCLTGIIAALICQGLSPLDAAHLGVAIHGFAGDLAVADGVGPSVLSTDLIEYLPRAFAHAHRS